jgi:hypothetical protein
MPSKRKITQNVIITPMPRTSALITVDPTVWWADSFAQDWFADALREARTGIDLGAIRREIIFAACFAESYIFEWARSKIPIEELTNYFPPCPRRTGDPQYRRRLQDKWKEIPKELFKDQKIPAAPNLKVRSFAKLLQYRNDLVHAAAGRPVTDAQPKETTPVRHKKMLRTPGPGWAVKIVADLVTDLHRQVGDPVPDYLEYP